MYVSLAEFTEHIGKCMAIAQKIDVWIVDEMTGRRWLRKGHNIMSNKLIYTAEDIAAIFDISMNSVYKLLHEEGFPSVTLNKRMYVLRESLIIWMKQNEGKIFNY